MTNTLLDHHYQCLAGVDEAGRGPLAGPVVAAAVILDGRRPIAGLDDSKRLSHAKRLHLSAEIKASALAWSVAEAGVAEIDRLNILNASLLAMQRAVEALAVAPRMALVDGLHAPALGCPAQAVVRGDSRVPAISAASIIAKVERDRWMTAMEDRYPGYGFAAHKGYPTWRHIAALARLGVTPIHRRSFAPVKEALNKSEFPAAVRHRLPGFQLSLE